LVVFVGAVIAAVRFVAGGLRTRNAEVFVPVRLGLGRFLELGLEFLLASDVLRTAIAPWFRRDRAAPAVHTIQTALNYFLGRDIREEREQLAREDGDPGRPGGGSAGSAGAVTGTATPPPRG